MTESRAEKRKKISIPLVVALLLITLINAGLSYLNGVREMSGLPELHANLVVGVLLPFVVVAFSLIWKRARNLGCALQILFITTVVFSCLNYQQLLGKPRKAPSIRTTFSVEFPDLVNLEIDHDGPLDGVAKSHFLAASAPDGSKKFCVLVSPILPQANTIAKMVPGWEKGVLKKVTRKISSGPITISGHEAHRVVSSLETQEYSTKLTTVLVMSDEYSYALSVSMFEPNTNDHEVAAFLDSFRINQ